MERTKMAIIDAFQQMLKEVPINKITVKSIVERCGINRNTFYYYFDGIPELVEYQLTVMADQLMDSFDEPDPGKELERIVNYFSQGKQSVLHIYRYVPRERFLLVLDKIAAHIVERSMKQATEKSPIPEEALTALIRYYKGALVGGFLDWLESGMSYDMDASVAMICEMMKGSTRKAIEKCREAQ